MKILQSTLPNGLRIITAHMPGARSLTAQIFVGTGSRQEDFHVNGGVAHFLEHLLFKGTKKYPSAQAISEAVDAVGGYNNAYTSEELTTYLIKVPAKHGELALDILGDMMTTPLLDAEEIERERGVIVEEMNVYRDDPSRFVGTMIPELIFAGNPLGRDIIGTEEVINTVPREEIVRFFGAHYAANNMVVAVAGKVDHDKVVEQAEALLGHLGQQEQPDILRVGAELSEERTIVQQKDTAQAHFVISARGYSYNDPKAPAARVVTAILGRGMSSRLFLNVRERQGLAYTVFADHASFVDTGIFSAYAGVNLDKLDQAITSVIQELKKITVEMVDEAELDKAKQQLCAGMEMGQESNSNVADAIGTQVVLLGDYKPVEERIEEIEAVTVEDVKRIAAEMLEIGGLRLALIAPEPEGAAKHFEAEVAVK